MLQLVFFLLFTIPLLADNPHIRHIYLTWQGNTSETMTVNVQTLNELSEIDLFYTEETCKNREAYKYHVHAQGEPFLEGENRRWIYHIELKNLAPGMTYCFVVGNAQLGFSEEQKFKTISKNKRRFRFITGGDCEVTPTAKALFKRAATCDPIALFLGGDYPSEVLSLKDFRKWDEWLDMYTENMTSVDGCLIPMVMAIGNHEAVGGFNQTPDKAPFYYRYFRQNPRKKSYFSLEFGKDMVLFVLDSGHTETYNGPQLAWLREILEKYAAKKIKFAIYHVPIYPSVRFSKPSLPYHIISKIMEMKGYRYYKKALLVPQAEDGIKYWLPLFDTYHMTAAFEHHDQTLKRTKRLFQGKEHPHGTLYLGDGGWGPELQYTPIQHFLSSCFAKAIGHVSFFWLVDVDRDTIHYRALTALGNVIDEYDQKIP